jgi:hypothetical protein
MSTPRPVSVAEVTQLKDLLYKNRLIVLKDQCA